jgi:predicted dehydrogenase
MTKTRIAVAGAGLIGLRHIEEIQKSTSCCLHAIVDPSPGAVALAKTKQVPLYTSIEALFEADKPDGIILATPNHLHVNQGLQCIAAGVPVLVEKPVGHTLEEGQRLVEAAERVGHKLLVGHHRPHSPILHKAVEIVQSGVLGSIVGVMGSAVFYKPDADGYYDPPFDWRRKVGGGPILLNMIHEVGNLRAIVGEIVAVQAFSSNATRGFEVEDTVAINLRFANGALGTFLLSDTAACARSWEQTSQENKAYASYEDEDAYVIVGTFGSLSVPSMRIKRYEHKEDRSWFKPFTQEVVSLERTDPLAHQIENFGQVIRGEAKPVVTGRDGLQNLRVTDAISQAARSGQLVNVPLD